MAKTKPTHIAKDNLIVGDVRVNGKDVTIDGGIHGDLHEGAEVHVGRFGRVEGNMSAKCVEIAGKVRGRIEAETLIIKAGGVFIGDVVALSLVIERGGRLEGTSRQGLDDEAVDGENTSAPLFERRPRAVEPSVDAEPFSSSVA